MRVYNFEDNKMGGGEQFSSGQNTWQCTTWGQ